MGWAWGGLTIGIGTLATVSAAGGFGPEPNTLAPRDRWGFSVGLRRAILLRPRDRLFLALHSPRFRQRWSVAGHWREEVGCE